MFRVLNKISRFLHFITWIDSFLTGRAVISLCLLYFSYLLISHVSIFDKNQNSLLCG